MAIFVFMSNQNTKQQNSEWTLRRLITQLATGMVVLRFVKTDGTERTATITRNKNLIPADKIKDPASYDAVDFDPAAMSVAYYDLVNQRWGSVSVTSDFAVLGYLQIQDA